jgi:hypothetical protein
MRKAPWLALLAAAGAFGQDSGKVFADQVAPILKTHCTPCHDDATRSSGLSVMSPGGLLAGGARRGAAVTPGKPDDSVLLKMARGQITPRMPLNAPELPPEKIGAIAAWIAGLEPVTQTKAAGKWWAFEKPGKVSPPEVKNQTWVKSEIDRFILRKLEDQGLTPAPEAAPQILLRRVCFDLVGMPPTPEEAKAFLADSSPDAYSKLVDRLLADPRYGERWGRHWLDLARYADTQGFEADRENYSMWRYRDYVIDAFNNDKPYDRFVKEQLAGDEIAPASPEARIALGFLRLGPRFQTTSTLESRQLTLDEMTATVGSAFLGLTLKCAQCHDHKYDPVPQKDYYRLQAFFVPIELTDVPAEFSDPAIKARMKAAQDRYSKELAEAQARFKAYQAPLFARLGDVPEASRNQTLERRIFRADANALTPNLEDTTFSLEEKRKYLDLLGYVDGNRGGRDMGVIRRQVARYEPKAHSVQNARPDSSKPSLPLAVVRVRGEYNRYGEVVQAGFPSAITGNTEPAALTVDRFGNIAGWRLPLANWIASPENPLTARVMMNRIWQHHFGSGIVGTPSDFGRNGSAPTHPELLDYLASRFVESQWSIKAMHRLILNSATYKQTSLRASKKEEAADPANRLLWRMRRTRLEGEAVRDSLLAVSGRLNPERGGPGVFPKLPDAMKDRMTIKNLPSWEPADGPESRRRSVYVFQRRQLEVPFLSLLDASVFQSSCERRSVSTTSLQALTLMNGDLITEEAAAFAGRVRRETGPDQSEQIRQAFWLALSRAPKAEEMTMARKFLDTGGVDGLVSFCRTLLNTNEFAYVD